MLRYTKIFFHILLVTSFFLGHLQFTRFSIASDPNHRRCLISFLSSAVDVNAPITVIRGNMAAMPDHDALLVPHFSSGETSSIGWSLNHIPELGEQIATVRQKKMSEKSSGSGFGSALFTSGESQSLLHVTTLGSGKGHRGVKRIVSASVKNALILASKNSVKNIAIPLLGTGKSDELSHTDSATAVSKGIVAAAKHLGSDVQMPSISIVLLGDRRSGVDTVLSEVMKVFEHI